ncbi:hypothetical protein GCM10029964_025760 [Kibdelosporangium lantanae]
MDRGRWQQDRSGRPGRGCSKASVEIAQQTDQQVALNLVESSPATQQMCTMDIRYPSFTVTLNAPLGDRTVVLIYQQRTT